MGKMLPSMEERGGMRRVDYYDLEPLLRPEERMVRDTVRQFVDREVLPIIGDCFERAEFPRQLIPQIAEMGLLGMDLEGYGCAGLNHTSYGLACQELERGDSGLRSFVSVPMCNLESVYTYEGTNEIHTLIIGQDITGLPAFS